ncbi:hypothetical protein GWN75_20190 [candidate division KSB1 bacterium]|nr:hypothetical protein [candidate division KSB1 bacterium]NIU92221.1 hypothetical protein [candidate division KSB1 bacterium]NIW20667.1 hypothetical protein [candidate division KSB1 bacterium]
MTDYIARQDNLVPASTTVTGTVLLLIFVLSHILHYTFPYELVEPQEKIEVRELIALKFETKAEQSNEKAFRVVRKTSSSATARANKVEEVGSKTVEESPGVTALVQAFDAKKLIPDQSRSQRRPVRGNTSQTSALKIDVTGYEQNQQVQNVNSFYARIRSSESRGNKSATVSHQSPSVRVGGNSSARVTSDIRGADLSGSLSSRSNRSRGIDNGGLAISVPSGRAGPVSPRTGRSRGIDNGGPAISMPSGRAGQMNKLDLNALIEWMKKHPGRIPGLVRYEMGHRRGDLSSAIIFTRGGHQFLLFLSCNEVELLLRICLIQKNTFTLLKDAGIKEESNYLTIGKVSWSNRQIHSLISTRKAPRGRASVFYSIFWSWWLKEQAGLNSG